MEHAEGHAAGATVAEEDRTVDHAPLPKHLVNDEIGAIEAAHRCDLLTSECVEQKAVEGARSVAAANRADGRGNDVVRGVGGQAGDDGVDIVGRLIAEMIVDELVHTLLGAGGGGTHGTILLGRWRAYIETIVSCKDKYLTLSH